MSNISVKGLLEDWVVNLPPKVYTALSPSSLGGCHRAHYFKLKGVAPTTPPSPSALLNFQVGFLWEQNILKALEYSGKKFEFQTSFKDEELNMAGSSDFIVDDKIMIDSKTQGSKWFWYREKARKDGVYDWWKENYNYIIQQGAYLLMSERAGKPLERSILAFISKDDGFVGEELDVWLNDRLRDEVLGRVKYMNECLQTETTPVCECDGWKLGYCDFGDPNTQMRNRTGKMVNTTCCSEDLLLTKKGV